MLTNPVRLLVGLVMAIMLVPAIAQPSIAVQSKSAGLVGGARTDSIIDPETLQEGTNKSGTSTPGPKTDTYDEDGNKTGTSNPNSRARILDEAIASLKQNPPIYVDPRAQLKLTKEQQDALAVQIQATGDPIFVAILPSQAGRPTVVTETIAKEIGKPGVYVTIVGVVYSAYATNFEAKHLLTQAFLQERHDGQAAVLSRFVDLSSQQLRGETPQPQPFPPFFIVIVACMALALPVILLLSGRRNREHK